jgi:hypothetical protein
MVIFAILPLRVNDLVAGETNVTVAVGNDVAQLGRIAAEPPSRCRETTNSKQTFDKDKKISSLGG